MINDAAEWIAVIDDDYALRYSLARYFKAHGILAEPYATADDYVDRPLSALPRCIVLDVQLLTGMSSFELVDWMNAQGKKVPVIFMTGLVDQNPELCARYPELRDTLSKP